MSARASWLLMVGALGCGQSTHQFSNMDPQGGGSGGTSAGGEQGSQQGGGTAGAPGEEGGAGGAPVDRCVGVVCDDPPASACVGTDKFKTYDSIGSCAEGECHYEPHEIACTCAAGACTTDPCIGVQCVSPPSPQCKDADTLTSYAAQGTCTVGSCSYVAVSTECAYGCSGGECLDNPCDTVTCDAPDECQQGPGTCAPATGECSYPNKANDSPCSNVDDNACTSDTCQAGVCKSGAAKSCPAPATCKTQGACNPSTGACSTPAAADHLSCGTNLECIGGSCSCTTTSCPNGCCTAAGACGACAPGTLLTRSVAVQDLAINASGLYFLESSNLVYSMPLAGGAATFLSYPPPAATMIAIVADASYVYGGPFGNNTPRAVGRMSAVGGAFTDIPGSAVYEGARLRANSTSIFAGSTLSSNYIHVFPKNGATPAVRLVASVAVNYAAFAVDDSFLYFISGNGTVISRVPVGDGETTTVASADVGETFNDIALAGSSLVVASSTRVGKVATAGGNIATLDSGAAYAIVADATNAFFFRSKGSNCASGSELFSKPVAGGNLRRLAVEPLTSCIRVAVHNAAAVYWLAGMSIQRIAK